MAGEISFSGLATGMDTSAIIDKLVALEKSRVSALNKEKSNRSKQSSILSDIVTKLGSLSSTAQGVDTSSELLAYKATSSKTTLLTAATSGTASAGTYTLRVNNLAQEEHNLLGDSGAGWTSSQFTQTGSVTVTVNGKLTTANYNSGDSLQTVVNTLNAGDARINASVIFDGTYYKIAVNGKDTGSSNSISFGFGGTALSVTETQLAENATLLVDGQTMTRSTNTISDIITGVTLSLVDEDNTQDIKLTIERDATAEKANLQKLVDGYNSVMSAVQKQLAYTGSTKGQDTLFGDSSLRSLQFALQSKLSSTYGGYTARDLGISSQSNGQLKFDSALYDTMMAKDSDANSDLVAGTSGLAAALKSVVDQFTLTGSGENGDGVLIARQKGITTRISDIDKQIEKINDRADALADNLKMMFSRLEQSISMIKSQGDQLLAALGSMSS